MDGTDSGQRWLQSEPATFEIVVQGDLGPRWADWFGAPAGQVSARPAGEQTTICLPVTDQVALLGYLQKLTDLGFPLLLVRRIPGTAVKGGHDVY